MNEKTMTTRLAAIALFVTCIAAHAQDPHVYEGYPVYDYYAQAPHMYEGFLHGHDYNRLRKNERIAFDMGVITGFFFAPAFGAVDGGVKARQSSRSSFVRWATATRCALPRSPRCLVSLYLPRAPRFPAAVVVRLSKDRYMPRGLAM
jgi:hypothetical protein